MVVSVVCIHGVFFSQFMTAVCMCVSVSLQGLAPLVDVQEVEQCLVGLGGTVNYKHFYEPDAGDKCDHDGGRLMVLMLRIHHQADGYVVG